MMNELATVTHYIKPTKIQQAEAEWDSVRHKIPTLFNIGSMDGDERIICNGCLIESIKGYVCCNFCGF